MRRHERQRPARRRHNDLRHTLFGDGRLTDERGRPGRRCSGGEAAAVGTLAGDAEEQDSRPDVTRVVGETIDANGGIALQTRAGDSLDKLDELHRRALSQTPGLLHLFAGSL